jgi:thioesterase domain-containing protein
MDIAKRYKPGTAFKGEILLFRSRQNRSVYEYLGWDNFCDHVKLVIIEGDHLNLYESEESYTVLSKNISELLQKADGNDS